MATLTTTAKIVLQATHTATAPTTDLATSSGAQGYVEKIIEAALTNGTTAGAADLMFSDRRTLSASATESLDLAGGVTDFAGNSLTFAKVKVLLVTASSANTNSVLVGGAGSNPWTGLLNSTGWLTLRPGDSFIYVANNAVATGCPVVGGSDDILLVANATSGSSVTYDIAVIGTSA